MAGHVIPGVIDWGEDGGGTTGASTPLPGPPAIGSLGSAVTICSAAFSHLGLGPIASMDQNVPRANQARLIFQPTVDEVIYDHQWKCSLRRAALVALEATPLWDYQTAFQLPTDPYCLKVWATTLDRVQGGSLATVDVSGDEGGAGRGRWTVEGRLLLADTDTIKILYGARVTDPNQFDPGLTAAIVLKLASKLAYPLTGKAPLAADLRRLYEIELARAKGSDSQQRSPRTVPSRFLTDVR